MTIKKIVFALLFIGLALYLFWFGGYLATNRISKSVEAIQAKLAFGHMKAYKDVHVDVMSGCTDQALDRLLHAIDEQIMLIAEFVQSNNSSKFEEYINLHQPGLMEELQSYKVDWSKTWKISGCKNAKSSQVEN